MAANYWADPKSGIAYQVQVEIPRPVMRTPYGVDTIGSTDALGSIPLRRTEHGQLLVRDVATLEAGTMPGQYDRYNMRRQITLTANVTSPDLGRVSKEVAAAIKRAGDLPTGVQVETRGQIPPLREMQSGLTIGLGLNMPELQDAVRQREALVALALAEVTQAESQILAATAMAESKTVGVAVAEAAIARNEADFQRWSAKLPQILLPRKPSSGLLKLNWLSRKRCSLMRSCAHPSLE